MITKQGVTVAVRGVEIYHGFDWYFGLALAHAHTDHPQHPDRVEVYDSRRGGHLAIVTTGQEDVDITLPNSGHRRLYADFMALVRSALKEV